MISSWLETVEAVTSHGQLMRWMVCFCLTNFLVFKYHYMCFCLYIITCNQSSTMDEHTWRLIYFSDQQYFNGHMSNVIITTSFCHIQCFKWKDILYLHTWRPSLWSAMHELSLLLNYQVYRWKGTSSFLQL